MGAEVKRDRAQCDESGKQNIYSQQSQCFQSVFFAFVASPGTEGMKKIMGEGRPILVCRVENSGRSAISLNAFVPGLIVEGNLSGTL